MVTLSFTSHFDNWAKLCLLYCRNIYVCVPKNYYFILGRVLTKFNNPYSKCIYNTYYLQVDETLILIQILFTGNFTNLFNIP